LFVLVDGLRGLFALHEDPWNNELCGVVVGACCSAAVSRAKIGGMNRRKSSHSFREHVSQ